MADLFLHLAFARRLRCAQGLHPLAGEAMARRPALVVLGAGLAALPAREHAGMSWFRRFLSGGGEAARWEKLLVRTPGQGDSELVTSILHSDDAAVGPMARFALGAGMLAHQLLEESLGPLTSSMAGPPRAAVERAQARLWLQTLDASTLGAEWRPALDFAEVDAHQRTLLHIERALKRVHGSGPGEGALGRWLKALAFEVGPLVAPDALPLPPSLSLADADARAAHFDQVGLVDKVKAASASFVVYANRLAEAFQHGSPEHAALVDALGKLDGMSADVDARRLRWKAWLDETHEATRKRGRNPKPAFAEGEVQAPRASDQDLASITKAMSLADVPPEPADSGPSPLPNPQNAPPVQASGAQGVGTPEPSAPPLEVAPPTTADIGVASVKDAPPAAAPQKTATVDPVVEETAPGRLGPPVSIAPEDVTEIPPELTPPSAPQGAPDGTTTTTGGNGVAHQALPEPGAPTSAPETEPPRE